MQHDSFAPAPVFAVHPTAGAHCLLDPPHEVPLCVLRQRDWFGRLAESARAPGYEPNDVIEDNNSEVAPTIFKGALLVLLRHITLVKMVQLLLLSPRSTMRRSQACWLHHFSVRRET